LGVVLVESIVGKAERMSQTNNLQFYRKDFVPNLYFKLKQRPQSNPFGIVHQQLILK
jgi:hypothetical protein